MTLFQDIRFGFRMLRRARGFTAVAVTTLALGIGAATALFSVVDAVLLRSLGYQDAARLLQISGRNKQGQTTGVSAADIETIQQRAHSFAGLGAARFEMFTLIGPREPESIYGQVVSPECFAVLGARALVGRTLAPADFEPGAPASAVISHQLWEKSFDSDPRIAGRRVLLNGTDYTIVGVMPAEFYFPHPAFQLWAPWRPDAKEQAAHRPSSFTVIARLRPRVTKQTAQAELTSISESIEREFPRTNTGWRAIAQPLGEQLLGPLRQVLLATLGASGFVLLIACLNVSNLLMARGMARSRELAVRAALGAARMRLAGQLLTESLAIAALGGLAGMPVRAVPIFPRMEQASLDGRVLAVCVLISAATAIVFGLLPAIELSRPNLDLVLREGGRSNTGGARRRRILSGLIALEAALSVVLLVGAGLMARTMKNILDVQPGFRAEHVLTAQLPSAFTPGGTWAPPPERIEYFGNILKRVARLPGVSEAAFVTGMPMASVSVNTLVRIEGRPAPGPGQDPRVGYFSVSADYFGVMGIPLLRGRAFTEADASGQPLVAVVNQAMARHFWPGEDAVGKRITTWMAPNPPASAWMTIVGVAADVRNMGLTLEPDSQLYTSFRQSLLSPQTAAIVLRTRLDPLALASAVRAEIHRVNSYQPVAEVKTMSQLVADSLARQRIYTLLLAIFGGLALALAGAGIFSVISWTVNQTRRDIGIRMALGATPGQVAWPLMRRALAETLAGAAVGLAVAAALSGILKSQLYQVSPSDPSILVAAPLVLAAAAALASYVPARRALRADPMAALREQ
jgi:putative ABC transport system permease protein